MIQLSNPLTDKYLSLKNIILNDHGFPWHFLARSTPSTDKEGYINPSVYQHTFLDRPGPWSRVGSPLIEVVTEVITEIMEHNSIIPEVIYRICANAVHPQQNTYQNTVPHYDHKFPHKNLLIYLSDSYGGATVCENNSFLGKEDDIITFEGEHYHGMPQNGRRIVLVSTYLTL